MPSSRILLALGFALLPVGLVAQRATPQGTKRVTPASPRQPQNTPSQDNKIKFRSSGPAIYDTANGLVHITKDVVIWQDREDFIFYAQDVNYSETKNQAVASGKLRVETRDSTIKGRKLAGDFNEKMLSMTGDVTITSHGKNDGITAKDNKSTNSKPVKITCDKLDWDYETRQAKISGNIHIYRESSVGTCNLITFDEPNNVALLQGNVRFGDEKKRVLVGEEIQVFIGSGKVQTDKPMRIEIPRDAEESGPTPAPRPARRPQSFVPERSIDPNVFNGLGITPPALATPSPTPTVADDEPPPAPADESENN